MYTAPLASKAARCHLIIDHRQGRGIDIHGNATQKQGEKIELEGQFCPHCRRPIWFLKRAECENPIQLANCDAGAISLKAQLTAETKWAGRYCRKCDQPVCRICAGLMEQNGGECTGTFEQVIEQHRQRERLYQEMAIMGAA